MKLEKQEAFYVKCIAGYKYCLANIAKDRAKKIEKLEIKKEYVSILYKYGWVNDYLIEVKITLVDTLLEEDVGYYLYYEDEHGDFYDEFFVVP